jgi:hypothetical protein
MSEIAVPELDARVHTQVMGLSLEQECEAGNTIDYDCDYMCGDCGFTSHDWEEGAGHLKKIPDYSTDIAAAWKVVEHFGQVEYFIDMSNSRRNGWRCAITGPEKVQGTRLTNHHIAYAETAPLAICLAALEVMEKIK